MSFTSAKKECILVFIILALNPHWSQQAPQGATSVDGKGAKCFTPNNEVGSCVPKEECSSLVELEQKKQIDTRIAIYIKASLCKNEKLSCCPNRELNNGATSSPTSTKRPISVTPTSQPTTLEPENRQTLDRRIQRLPSNCGQREVSPLRERINGGVPAELGEFPWLVVLGFRNRYISANEAVPRWGCGGTLITDRHVLTAAHCHHEGDLIVYLVRAGELNLDDNKADGATPEDIQIKTWVQHPNYAGLVNDIAVAFLEKAVTLTRNVKPICLPVSKESRNNLFEGEGAYIAGWGAKEFRGQTTFEQNLAQIGVVSSEKECKPRYAIDNRAVIDERVICAGVPSGVFDACQGDSGGPLMLQANSTFNIIGVVSYGDGCGKANTPGVYTRVTAFLDWILKVVDETQ